MSGIVILERRDLTRLLGGLLYAEKRVDVRVDVKYYVQFSYVGSKPEDMAVQTLVEPLMPPTRSQLRDIVKQAVARLDAGADGGQSGGSTRSPDDKGTTATEPASTATPGVSAAVHHSLALETGVYDIATEFAVLSDEVVEGAKDEA